MTFGELKSSHPLKGPSIYLETNSKISEKEVWKGSTVTMVTAKKEDGTSEESIAQSCIRTTLTFISANKLFLILLKALGW